MSGIRIAHAVLCAILFACAAVLLGLTAYHIHFTETMFTGVAFYVPIVVELLVTSCLAIIVCLCFFIVITLHLGGSSSFGAEAFFIAIIWIMFLVGASVFSRGWHNVSWCVGSRHVCRILSAIIAFAWINWVLTTGVLIVCLMDLASKESSHTDAARTTAQTSQTATTAPVTTAAEA